MGKWIKEHILDVIQTLPIAGTVVVALLAMLNGVPWWVVSFVVLAMIPLTLLGINQYGLWKKSRTKKLTKLSDKELEDTVRAWMNISAWGIKPLDLKDDLLFAYELTFGGKSIVISRHKKEPDVIYVGARIQFTSSKTEMSDTDWERFGSQLSIELAQLGIMFSPIGKQKQWECIELLEPVILDDGLTSFYFRTKVFFVIRAFILVLEVWKEALRQSKKPILGKEGSQP